MYRQTITRLHRTAFVILIDQSGSMAERACFDGRPMSKAEALAEATNRLCFELLCRARRDEGVRDYFDVALVGYSGDGVRSGLDGGTPRWVSIAQIARSTVPVQRYTALRRTPDGRPMLASFALPAWVMPRSVGATPMYEALLEAHTLLDGWCSAPENSDSYPPTLFNITDGESSDSDDQDILEVCDRIKQISTSDGNVLIVNIHISSDHGEGNRVIFPCHPRELGEQRYARLLYEASSTMPSSYDAAILAMRGDGVRPPFKGMSFNASLGEVITMMNIGSMSVNIL